MDHGKAIDSGAKAVLQSLEDLDNVDARDFAGLLPDLDMMWLSG